MTLLRGSSSVHWKEPTLLDGSSTLPIKSCISKASIRARLNSSAPSAALWFQGNCSRPTAEAAFAPLAVHRLFRCQTHLRLWQHPQPAQLAAGDSAKSHSRKPGESEARLGGGVFAGQNAGHGRSRKKHHQSGIQRRSSSRHPPKNGRRRRGPCAANGGDGHLESQPAADQKAGHLSRAAERRLVPVPVVDRLPLFGSPKTPETAHWPP